VKVSSIKSHISINLCPVRNSTPQLQINAHVVPQITGTLSSKRVRKSEWQHLKGLDLADLKYDEPLLVDMLLGTDIVRYVTRSSRREGKVAEPVGLETGFGWTLMGTTGTTTTDSSNTLITPLESSYVVFGT